eukprot:Hpha_TRINITY_DN16831_c1_g1::TRINITY_DN16831_c1_g1_i14::g.151780::m.151780
MHRGSLLVLVGGLGGPTLATLAQTDSRTHDVDLLARAVLALGQAVREVRALAEVLLVLLPGSRLLLARLRRRRGVTRPGVLADLGVGLEERRFDLVRGETGLEVLPEVGLELVGVLLLHRLHPLTHVVAQDARAQLPGVEVATPETREAPLAVGDEETTVDGALQHREHTVAHGRAGETDVEESLEGAALALLLDLVVLTSHLLHPSVRVRQALEGQQTTRAQQTSGVAGGVVGEPRRDPVLLQLVGVRRRVRAVALELSAHDLGDHVPVGDTGHQTELGGEVLVLVLSDQQAALLVVSLSLTPPPVLDLVALEVRVRLLHLHESDRHFALPLLCCVRRSGNKVQKL